MSKGVGIELILKKYIEKYFDIKTITLCTTEGTQILSGTLIFSLLLSLYFLTSSSLSSSSFLFILVNRQYWDGNGSYSSAPSFTVSFDQVKLLFLFTFSTISLIFCFIFCFVVFSFTFR